MAKKNADAVLPTLTGGEQDLLSYMEHVYQLETDSLGGDPALHRLTDNDVMRPASANRTTIRALQERGLIVPAKSRDLLKVVWRTKNKPQT
jgi:hypothetical protein